jgi:hypothetical protein
MEDPSNPEVPIGDLTFINPVESYLFIFNGIGPNNTQGEEIARIDMRDGTVTYRVPDAGRQAAEIFWNGFEGFIKSAITRFKIEERDREKRESEG